MDEKTLQKKSWILVAWGRSLVSTYLAGCHRWEHYYHIIMHHMRVLQYWASLWPQTFQNLGIGMVLGHSSPCFCCSPHPQRTVWGNCRDLELRQQWQGMVELWLEELEELCPSHSFDLGSDCPVQLLSVLCCWHTQCHLQTAPALGKGQTVHRGEGRTWALAVQEQHQDWYRTQCRHGCACQADREALQTPIMIPSS